MNSIIEISATLLLLLNFRLLGSSRLLPCISTVAWQAVILSIASLAIHQQDITARLLAIITVTVILKAGALPWLLKRAIHEVGISRELSPIIGYTLSLLIGVVFLCISFVLSRALSFSMLTSDSLFLTMALFTMLSGLFIIIARKKASTQVVGYIAMENGIYAFGLAFAVQEPFLVEMGVLFDVFIAVLIMGIAIFNISREFDHIDTDQLTSLKD